MSSLLAYSMKVITERRRKLDIYIFFTVTRSILLLVDY